MEQIPISIGSDNFAENPEPRVPCILLLDVSYSMTGDPIERVNQGLFAYKDELIADGLAAKRVETAIVTFGEQIHTVCDFTTAVNFFPPTLQPSGMTPMGAAVHQAIDILDERKSIYRANGIDYFRPWLFLMTDGAPTDEWESAAERAKEGDAARKFAFFTVGVENADFDVLQRFTNRTPLALREHRFREMFVWLSSSLTHVSRSAPTDEVPLSPPSNWGDTPPGWGQA